MQDATWHAQHLALSDQLTLAVAKGPLEMGRTLLRVEAFLASAGRFRCLVTAADSDRVLRADRVWRAASALLSDMELVST